VWLESRRMRGVFLSPNSPCPIRPRLVSSSYLSPGRLEAQHPSLHLLNLSTLQQTAQDTDYVTRYNVITDTQVKRHRRGAEVISTTSHFPLEPQPSSHLQHFFWTAAHPFIMSQSTTDSEPEAVQYSTSSDSITIITLSRASHRNAVDASTARKLYNAFLRYESDDTQKICVFRGANATFCAGADLQAFAKSSSGDATHFGPVQGRNIAPMGPSRMQIRKPVICAVSGFAVAGGLELSLIGDMRIVEEDATFGVFCRRFGVPLIDGGTVRLQAIVGLGRAMDMILTGRPVGAQEALSMGLANRVVPKGEAFEEAMKIARQLLVFPQLCMNKDRQSAYYAAYEAKSFEDAMKYEYANAAEVLGKESLQGAKRFAGGAGRSGSFAKL
jgi:enoyl-CoA hydratase/carnithine racemase